MRCSLETVWWAASDVASFRLGGHLTPPRPTLYYSGKVECLFFGEASQQRGMQQAVSECRPLGLPCGAVVLRQRAQMAADHLETTVKAEAIRGSATRPDGCLAPF